VNGLRARRWSPYAVGAGIGVLSWLAFAAVGGGLDVTPPFEQLGGMLERAIAPGWTDANGWWDEHAPEVSWQWSLLVGVFLGSFWSARLADQVAHPVIAPIWRRRFGRNPSRRLAWAFGGGALMAFGARLAGGCTMGHGITGALSLAVSSWLFMAVAFATAIVTAFTLFGAVEGSRAGRPR
jgi:uncharacterized membrane protein YedE/YeeE